MIILLAAFGLLSLYRIKFARFHADYMEPGQTGAVKGIFAMIVLFSHARSYMTITSAWDNRYCILLNLLGQLMVALFFFYSGYGILQSYSRKRDYDRTFFSGRIVKTLVHFDLAVALFLLLSLALGVRYPLKNYFLCWVGWESLGNSNWFIFDMLALYLLTLAAMALANRLKKRPLALCVAATLLSLGLWVALLKVRHYYYETCWYTTLLCFPAGLWYGLVKERADRLLRTRWLSLAALGAVLAVFALLYLRRHNVWWYSLCACVFCLAVVFLTAKVKVDNPALRWLGRHSFSIYMLQRLPMILMDHVGLSRYNLLFLALSILVTLPLAWGFDRLLAVVDRALLGRGKVSTT